MAQVDDLMAHHWDREAEDTFFDWCDGSDDGDSDGR